MRFESFGRGFAAGYGAANLVFDAGQCINEIVGSATCTDADNGVGLHITECRFRYRLLQCFFVHDPLPRSKAVIIG